jgi:hypothetical protein
MTRILEGFQSDTLRAALEEAVAGKPRRLADALCNNGGIPGPRPNLKLALAFGQEVGARKGEMAPLLNAFAADDAASDVPRAFLPVLAAHGWAGRLRAGREVPKAWDALFILAADYRAPVRVGVIDALISVGVREGQADEILSRSVSALELEDRDDRFTTAALMLEVLTDTGVLSCLRDHEGLCEYLSRVIGEIADAPRSAERSEGRRRVLISLPKALAAAVTQARSADHALAFFERECSQAQHPDVRAALSKAIEAMRTSTRAQGGAVVESARKALEASAKPVRDHARVRQGTGRGRDSRRTR